MKIISAEYITSGVTISQMPEDKLPEVCLAGRSNVGKSTFINAVLQRKQLVKVSSKPGKTRTLNFFLVNEKFYFVDVPGYGYAKTGRHLQEQFGQMMEEYLSQRDTLKFVFLLVDSRHKPTKDDVMMYQYLKYFNIKIIVIATKVDKISKNDRFKAEKLIKETLEFDSNDLFLFFSSVTKENIDKVYQEITKNIR